MSIQYATKMLKLIDSWRCCVYTSISQIGHEGEYGLFDHILDICSNEDVVIHNNDNIIMHIIEK